MSRMSQVVQLDAFLKQCMKDKFPLEEFKCYLDKIEKNGEILDFYLWYQDYKLVFNFAKSKIINYASGLGQIQSTAECHCEFANEKVNERQEDGNLPTVTALSNNPTQIPEKGKQSSNGATPEVDAEISLELHCGASLPTLDEIDHSTSSRSSMQIDDDPTLVNDVTPWEINDAVPWDVPFKGEEADEFSPSKVAEKMQKMRYKCDSITFTVPADAPFRREINWAISHFFMHKSVKQLNLPECMREELRDKLMKSTDPIVFEKIVDHIYLALRWQSFPSFIEYKKKVTCKPKTSILSACRSIFRKKQHAVAH